jgi:hypothetical protein
VFQSNAHTAMADNVIDNRESEELMGNLKGIQDIMSAISGLKKSQLQPQGAELPTPASLGIDRHRIMGIPIGPSLTLNNPIPVQPQSAPSSEASSLNLSPSGTTNEREIARATALEEAVN